MNIDDIKPDIVRAVRIALEEDIGTGDITAELIPEEQNNKAHIITREDCVVCGQAWVDETFNQLGGLNSIKWHVNDGDKVTANTILVSLEGNTRRLLTGERTALNFLQLLSGTATTAAEYATLVEGTNIKILDTRKTIPGLRTAQKYAVRIGGCYNHRIGLFDAFLIKENHIAACGGIKSAVAKARSLYPDKKLEVEVENLDELREAIECGVDVVMLDNFTDDETEAALKLKNKNIFYEVSGNITDSSIANYHALDIDYISVGAITKYCRAIDLSLKTYGK